MGGQLSFKYLGDKPLEEIPMIKMLVKNPKYIHKKIDETEELIKNALKGIRNNNEEKISNLKKCCGKINLKELTNEEVSSYNTLLIEAINIIRNIKSKPHSHTLHIAKLILSAIKEENEIR